MIVLAEAWCGFEADWLAVGEVPGAAGIAEGAHAVQVGIAQDAAGEQVFVVDVIDVGAEDDGGGDSVCLQRLLGLEAIVFADHSPTTVLMLTRWR